MVKIVDQTLDDERDRSDSVNSQRIPTRLNSEGGIEGNKSKFLDSPLSPSRFLRTVSDSISTLSSSISKKVSSTLGEEGGSLVGSINSGSVEDESKSIAIALAGPLAPLASLVNEFIDVKSLLGNSFKFIGNKFFGKKKEDDSEDNDVSKSISELKESFEETTEDKVSIPLGDVSKALGDEKNEDSVIGKLEQIRDLLGSKKDNKKDKRGVLGTLGSLLLFRGGFGGAGKLLSKVLGGSIGKLLLRFVPIVGGVLAAGFLGFKFGEKINKFIDTKLSEFLGRDTSLGSELFDIIDPIVQKISTSISNAKAAIEKFFNDIVDVGVKFGNFISDSISKVVNLYNDIVQKVSVVIETSINTARELAKSVESKLDKAVEFLKNPLSIFKDNDSSSNSSQTILGKGYRGNKGSITKETFIPIPQATSPNSQNNDNKILKGQTEVLKEISNGISNLNRRASSSSNSSPMNANNIPNRPDDFGLNLANMGRY